MNWTIVIFILVLIVLMDKGLTLINLKLVMKNNPEVDALTIEKNPMAREMFRLFGLYGGTAVYAVIGFLTLLLALYSLHFATSIWAPENSYGVALYIIMMAYGFVIMNNFYFMFRFAKLL